MRVYIEISPVTYVSAPRATASWTKVVNGAPPLAIATTPKRSVFWRASTSVPSAERRRSTKEPLAYLHAGRLRDAVAVRDAGGAIECRVGAVQRNAVLPESGVLVLDELEVDLRPASVMHDKQIGLRALRARDCV
jgi:hypothetical protein